MSTVTSNFQSDFLHKTIPFFSAIKNTAEILHAETYIVGGSVRDMLMGKRVDDADIVPFGIDYNLFANTLAKMIKCSAIPFKDNIRLMKNGYVIDVSKPRGESIRDDLALRDFTINNLACGLNGQIIGDQQSIHNKIICTVHDKAFDDDPLRILRAFRFKAVFGFPIHEETKNLILKKLTFLSQAAMERVLEEIKKTFVGKYFETLFDDKLFLKAIKIIAPRCNLNSQNVIRLKKIVKNTDDITPLFFALFFEGKDAELFFKNIPLSSRDYKVTLQLLKAYNNIDFTTLGKKEERLKTAWKFYSIISDLIIYIKCKNPEKSNLIDILTADTATIDPTKAMQVDGKTLIELGLKPSPIFSAILEDVREKLILGIIDQKVIKSYIDRKYNQMEK